MIELKSPAELLIYIEGTVAILKLAVAQKSSVCEVVKHAEIHHSGALNSAGKNNNGDSC